MRWAAGRPGWRITSHNASRTGRGLGVATWCPLAVVMCVANTRDSGSHFHAKTRLHRQNVAATRPGADSPKFAANDPIAGPITTPRLVAAESHPSALARSWGAIVSATYAWATPVVPPPSP